MSNVKKNFEILGAEAPNTVGMQQIFTRNVMEKFQEKFPKYAEHLENHKVSGAEKKKIEAYTKKPSQDSHVDNAFVVNLYHARFAPSGTIKYVSGVQGVKAALVDKYINNNAKPWIASVFADCILGFLKDRPVERGEPDAFREVSNLAKSWDSAAAVLAHLKSPKPKIHSKPLLLLPYKFSPQDLRPD